MPRVGLATFISEAGLYLVLASPFYVEGPLHLRPPHSQSDRKDDIETGQWLQLLRPFTAVKNLYLSEEIVLCIGPALQELVGGRTTGVLPALQNISLKGLQPSGPVQEGIGQFVASRQVTSRPIAVYRWDNSESEQDNWDSEQGDSDSEQDEVSTSDDR